MARFDEKARYMYRKKGSASRLVEVESRVHDDQRGVMFSYTDITGF